MNADKYALREFRKIQGDKEKVRALADELERDIQRELHGSLKAKMAEIAERLNQQGHNLRYEDEPIPGDISYRDDGYRDGRYFCRLRIAAVTTIPTGYADTVDPEEGSRN